MFTSVSTRLLSLVGLVSARLVSARDLPLPLAGDSDDDVVSLLQTDRGARRHTLSKEPVYFWSGKNGDLSRTGTSAFAAPNNVSAGPKWSFIAEAEGLVRAAPLIDAEKNIYLSTIAGKVYKMSSEGEILWSYDAGAELPGVPALANGHFFAMNKDGNAFALDTATGAERWRVKAAACSSGDTWSTTASSSIVVLPVTDPLLCKVSNTHIVALDVKDGSKKWLYRPDTAVYNFLSAIVEGSLVFADLNGRTYRLDLNDGSVIWKFNDTSLNPMAMTTGGAVVGPNRIVYTTSNVMKGLLSGLEKRGQVTAFDFDTGKVLWSQSTDFEANNAAAVGSLHPSGKGPLSVVVGVGENPSLPPQRPGSKEGRVLAFDATTGEKLEWEYKPPTWPFAAAAGDTISHVCLPDSFSNPAIGGDGTVYIGFEDGRLYAIRDADGNGKISDSEVSSYDFGNAFQGSPGIAPDMLVATPCNGMHVYKA